MSKNIWGIGFIVLLVGAFITIWFARSQSDIPSSTMTPRDSAQITISDSDHSKGANQAKLTLIEFGDFQCPACAAYYPVVEEIIKKYPNDLKFVFKNFPLTQIHNRAQIAAQAAEAAGLQGKYWEMYYLLYKNQNIWNKATGTNDFEKYAESINLDLKTFTNDFDSDAVKNKINNDVVLANTIGVNGTPTFYLNNTRLPNPKSEAEFKTAIETFLKTN